MYQEQARRQGQDISTTTDDATFAGGLRHITSVLPSLMNDIIQHAPESQKVCHKLSLKEKLRKIHTTFSIFSIVSSISFVFLTPPLSPFFFVDSN
jgi:hypothetical protein